MPQHTASPQAARLFALNWIQAWNDHDLDGLLIRYAEGVHFVSPFAKLVHSSDGVIIGKEALRTYYANVLAQYPELNFELIQVYCGAESLVVHYHSVFNLHAAEFLEFDEAGLICRVRIHYAQ